MADRFSSFTGGLESPASDLVPIVPSDTTDLPEAVRGINVAQSGSVRVRTVGGSLGTVYIAAGGAFPLRVQRVYATGTDAVGITGLI